MTFLDAYQRIFCALDTTETDQAFTLAKRLKSHVGGVKLGLEFFGANGPAGFRTVAESGQPIFLDLKLHDIPNTVASAIHALMPLKPHIMTVHTAGGPAMMAAAVQAASDAADRAGCARPLMVGVTVLTSLDGDDLAAVGYQPDVAAQVTKMARLAQDSGLDGVVCSPLEIDLIREACGPGFKLVVPGIRPAGSARGDQKRIMTPRQAVDRGADYIVIGRPITQAADPVQAARAIAEELKG
tara:strand:+ start:18280 stop:19002 length:723 start_codon:yes stop_codon:yes gene_type:complete